MYPIKRFPVNDIQIWRPNFCQLGAFKSVKKVCYDAIKESLTYSMMAAVSVFGIALYLPKFKSSQEFIWRTFVQSYGSCAALGLLSILPKKKTQTHGSLRFFFAYQLMINFLLLIKPRKLDAKMIAIDLIRFWQSVSSEDVQSVHVLVRLSNVTVTF